MRYSREHAQATRARLVEAGARVLRESGLAGATVDRIATAAGLTHGALYRHFPDRDALLREALALAEAPLRDAATSPAGLFATLLDPTAPTSLLAALAGEMPRASPTARAAFEDELRHLLAALQAEGEPDGTGVARLATLIGALAIARGVADPALAAQALSVCRRLAPGLPGLLAGTAGPRPNRFAGQPLQGAADPLPRRVTEAAGLRIAHVDAGAGRPVVFLNSIAFTAYCWRNVIGLLAPQARCLAPDLPGSGASGPAPGAMRVFDQVDALQAWLDALGLRRGAVLVGHEWGATMAFELARRAPARVAGIVHLGATLGATPTMYPTLWAGWHRRLREPGGEGLILDEDGMLEQQLHRGTLRRLAPEVAEAYRAMWPRYGAARLPLLRMVQDMPIDGEPADVAAMAEADMAFMAASPMPKLYLRVTPGWRRIDPHLAAIRAWPNQQEREIPGVLLPMEDAPDQIASAIADFLETLPD
jgi:haloalkane dehalogenase